MVGLAVDVSVDLFNNSGPALRNTVCLFTSGTYQLCKVFHPLHKKNQTTENALKNL